MACWRSSYEEHVHTPLFVGSTNYIVNIYLGIETLMCLFNKGNWKQNIQAFKTKSFLGSGGYEIGSIKNYSQGKVLKYMQHQAQIRVICRKEIILLANLARALYPFCWSWFHCQNMTHQRCHTWHDDGEKNIFPWEWLMISILCGLGYIKHTNADIFASETSLDDGNCTVGKFKNSDIKIDFHAAEVE